MHHLSSDVLSITAWQGCCGTVQQLGPYPAAPEAEGRASSCCMAIPCRDGRWVREHQENLCLWKKVMERQMW